MPKFTPTRQRSNAIKHSPKPNLVEDVTKKLSHHFYESKITKQYKIASPVVKTGSPNPAVASPLKAIDTNSPVQKVKIPLVKGIIKKLDFSPVAKNIAGIMSSPLLSPRLRKSESRMSVKNNEKENKEKKDVKDDDEVAKKLFHDETEETTPCREFGEVVDSEEEEEDCESNKENEYIDPQLLDQFVSIHFHSHLILLKGIDVPSYALRRTPKKVENKKTGLLGFLKSPKMRKQQTQEDDSPNTLHKKVLDKFNGSLTDSILDNYCNK